MSAPRILVVDDEEASGYIMGRILRRHGFNVTVVDGVDAAREKAAERFDLVVSDVRMPGGGAKAVRAIWPDAPFLTVSGVAADADVGKGEFIAKDLVAAVRAKLAKEDA